MKCEQPIHQLWKNELNIKKNRFRISNSRDEEIDKNRSENWNIPWKYVDNVERYMPW